MSVKVSIVCVTYNHEEYIAQAIEGFIQQKTNFKFKVYIYDDASTDKTSDIIQLYVNKFPDLFVYIRANENNFQKGVNLDRDFIWPLITSEYVAYCEGDDYWIDPNKLQKQTDILDKNKDCTICFHPVKVVWEDGEQKCSIFPTPSFRFYKKRLSFNDLIQHNFIQTNSVMYRWCLKDCPNELPRNINPTDYFVHLLHAQRGDIIFLPDIMSCYRKHRGGIWYGVFENENWFLKYTIPHLSFYRALETKFKCDKKNEQISLIFSAIPFFLKNKKFSIIEQMSNEYGESYIRAIEKLMSKSSLVEQKFKKKKRKYKRIIIVLATICILLFVIIIHRGI